MRLKGAAAVAAALAFLSPAVGYAQKDTHAHHGGQAVKIGKYEAELVVKGTDVTLIVLDDKDQKVDASKMSASAEVLAKGNEKKTLELTPAGDNRLAGKADFPVEGKFRATVTLKTAQGEAGKGRYSVDVQR